MANWTWLANRSCWCNSFARPARPWLEARRRRLASSRGSIPSPSRNAPTKLWSAPRSRLDPGSRPTPLGLPIDRHLVFRMVRACPNGNGLFKVKSAGIVPSKVWSPVRHWAAPPLFSARVCLRPRWNPLPHHAGVAVGPCNVAVVLAARLDAAILGILSIEWLGGFRCGNLAPVVVALGLTGADNGGSRRSANDGHGFADCQCGKKTRRVCFHGPRAKDQVKSGDIAVAAPARAELLFRSRTGRPFRCVALRRSTRTTTLSLTTRAAPTAVEAGAAWTTRTTGAFRTRRADFVRRDFAVAVFVEFSQRGWGVLNFLFINHAIVIDVKRGEKRGDHRALAGPPGPARPAGADPIAGRRAFTARWRSVVVLGEGDPRQRAE